MNASPSTVSTGLRGNQPARAASLKLTLRCGRILQSAFRPHPLWSGAHLQTIATLLRPAPKLTLRRERLLGGSEMAARIDASAAAQAAWSTTASSARTSQSSVNVSGARCRSEQPVPTRSYRITRRRVESSLERAHERVEAAMDRARRQIDAAHRRHLQMMERARPNAQGKKWTWRRRRPPSGRMA